MKTLKLKYKKHYTKIFLLTLCLSFTFTFHTFAQEKPVPVNWKIIAKLDKGKHPNASRILGKKIKIKGFMIPIDFSSKKVTSFLFAPYFPACMHIPPPPPDKLILAKTKKGVEITDPWLMTEVQGILKLDTSNPKEYSYTMDVESIKMK